MSLVNEALRRAQAETSRRQAAALTPGLSIVTGPVAGGGRARGGRRGSLSWPMVLGVAAGTAAMSVAAAVGAFYFMRHGPQFASAQPTQVATVSTPAQDPPRVPAQVAPPVANQTATPSVKTNGTPTPVAVVEPKAPQPLDEPQTDPPADAPPIVDGPVPASIAFDQPAPTATGVPATPELPGITTPDFPLLTDPRPFDPPAIDPGAQVIPEGIPPSPFDGPVPVAAGPGQVGGPISLEDNAIFVKVFDVPGLPRLELGGIAWSPGRAIALINGTTAMVGEDFGGVVIVQIERNRIKCKAQGKTFYLRLP